MSLREYIFKYLGILFLMIISYCLLFGIILSIINKKMMIFYVFFLSISNLFEIEVFFYIIFFSLIYILSTYYISKTRNYLWISSFFLIFSVVLYWTDLNQIFVYNSKETYYELIAIIITTLLIIPFLSYLSNRILWKK